MTPTSANRFRIFVRDRPTASTAELLLIGEIDTYLSFTATNKHNDIGSWQLSLEYGNSLIQPGRGIVVFANDEPNWPVFSGPIRQITSAWSKDDGYTVLVTGLCDNSILRERTARINPERGTFLEALPDSNDIVPTAWQPIVFDYIDDTHYTNRLPNNTGEWIWYLLILNYTNFWYAGDSDDSREVRQLKIVRQLPPEIRALPNDTAWQGVPINMSDLSTAMFQAAEAAGLSLRFQWQPMTKSSETTNPGTNGIFLSIAPINDLSENIVFGPDQGNMDSYELNSVAPDATRLFIEAETTTNGRRWLGYRKNKLFDPPGWVDWDSRNSNGEHYLAADWSDPYGARQAIEVDWNTTAETFVDARDIPWPFQPDPRNSNYSDPPHAGSEESALIDQTVLASLVENGPKGLLTMTTLDTPGCQYGKDYNVSDVVRVLIDTSFLPASMREDDGVIREVVREVQISCTKDAIWKISPVVGSADSSPTPYIYRALKKLRKQVEDTTNRVEGDQHQDVMPYAPHIGIVTASGNLSTAAPSHTFDYTDRPRVDPVYIQLYVNTNGTMDDPRMAVYSQSELELSYRDGDNGDWVLAPQSQIYPAYTGMKLGDALFQNSWYHNSNMATGVNSVRYWRARFVANGVYSPWSNVVKVTAASSALNTSGSLSLNTPSPSTRHRFAQFNITGTDTTRGSLQLQRFFLGNWSAVTSVPTYTGNTFSFPYLADDSAGVVQLRVQAFDNADRAVSAFKTSNTINLTVVAP